MPEPVDVVVVGAGMAGAAITATLAARGVRVVCLEQGPWIAADDYPHHDPLYDLRRSTDWSTAPDVRQLPWDYPVESQDTQALMFNAVGGSSLHYTAVWLRFRPTDFRRGSEHGLAPDWPISYSELAPYYDRVDEVIGISGLAGDPAYPPRAPRPCPPLPLGGTGRAAARGLTRLGWHHWPLDLAVLSRDYAGRAACNNCGGCQAGCPRGSLGSSAVTWWPRALRAGALLRTRARAERVVLDAQGRASGVEVLDVPSGNRSIVRADRVVVCANGIGTPRLLSLSDIPNRSDQIGRNLMHHGLAVIEAWVPENVASHQGAVGGALYTAEFAETDRTTRRCVNGFTVVTGSRLNGPGYQACGSHSGNVAPWGHEHHAWFREHFGRGLCLTVTAEDLPLPENRVTLSSTMRDPYGLPAPRVTYRLAENDRRLVDFAVDRAQQLAAACDAWDVRVNRFDAGDHYRPPAWHLMGTARMGDDPEQSVTDRWHQCWDVPGLYVCDGSSFVTSGGVNPTATIAALAVRCAEGMLVDGGRGQSDSRA